MPERRWIQKAIKNPGALRSTAKRMGLVRGDEPLSETDLRQLESHARASNNLVLLRRVRLARTLRKLRR